MTILEENSMRMRAVVAAANIGFIYLLVVGIAAEAAELSVIDLAAAEGLEPSSAGSKPAILPFDDAAILEAGRGVEPR